MSGLPSDPEGPKTFNESCNHQEPRIRIPWKEAMKKELNDMQFKKLWTTNKIMEFQQTED